MKQYLERLSSMTTRLCLHLDRVWNSRVHVGRRSLADGSPDLTYYKYECKQRGFPHAFQNERVLTIRSSPSGLGYNFLRSYTDLDGLPSLRLAGDKIYCYEVMRSLGIPIPPHVVVRNLDLRPVLTFRRACRNGIVIKPARDTGDAVGVAIRPEGPWAMFRALQVAAAYSPDVLVEEYCEGGHYRLLFCQGEFLAASARLPAMVRGDGRKSVIELIDDANWGRREEGDVVDYSPETRPILYKIPCDERIKSALRKRGLGLESVPSQGQAVQLQDICHWLWGGEYRDVTDEVCPSLIATAAALVRALGIKLAGVDVIASDISDCRHGGYVINEVNTTPALLVHYEVQNPDKRRPVGYAILQKVLGTSQGPAC